MEHLADEIQEVQWPPDQSSLQGTHDIVEPEPHLSYLKDGNNDRLISVEQCRISVFLLKLLW